MLQRPVTAIVCYSECEGGRVEETQQTTAGSEPVSIVSLSDYAVDQGVRSSAQQCGQLVVTLYFLHFIILKGDRTELN